MMENASLVMQQGLKSLRDDGFDLNGMRCVDISNLLLDRLEGAGFLVIKAPVKREEVPPSTPSYLGKNLIAVMAMMMRSDKQFIDVGDIRVRWNIPVDEEGDISYLESLGYAERDRFVHSRARVTDQGRRVVEQARAYGYKPEPEWPSWAR